VWFAIVTIVTSGEFKFHGQEVDKKRAPKKRNIINHLQKMPITAFYRNPSTFTRISYRAPEKLGDVAETKAAAMAPFLPQMVLCGGLPVFQSVV
jgi:ribosome maturation protein Sdo1